MVYLERKRQGRLPHPSAALIDSQSSKTTESGGERSYDGGKKVNGRKRHILVDTLGNLLVVAVHSAGVADSVGAKLVLERLPLMWQRRLEVIWADGAYEGTLWVWLYTLYQIVLAIVKRSDDQKGFVVLPRRWVVERSFAWMGRYRRLIKDYEHCTKSAEGMCYAASIHIMLKRLPA
jgi:putative transposase